MDYYTGERVHICGNHPWAGEVGEAVKVERTGVGPALRVRLDNGTECFVFQRSHIQILKS